MSRLGYKTFLAEWFICQIPASYYLGFLVLPALYLINGGGKYAKKSIFFRNIFLLIDTPISYQLGDTGIGKHRMFTQNFHVKDGCIISVKELYRDPIRFCFTLAAQFEMWKSDCEGKIDIATVVFVFVSSNEKWLTKVVLSKMPHKYVSSCRFLLHLL